MGVRKSKPEAAEPMTEQTIQKRLNHFFASWKYNVDGLFVFSWESDKLLWTKAGYIYEFEIKISRADFRNDFKHKPEKHIILAAAYDRPKAEALQLELFEKEKKERSHWSLESLQHRYGSVDYTIDGKKLPNYFYYAVPEGLIQPDEVPEYAGLIWLAKENMRGGGIIIKKEAPRLHKQKYTDAELNLGEKFYYNWDSCTRSLREAIRSAEDAQKALKDELDSKNQERPYQQVADELKKAEECRDRYYNRKCQLEHDAYADHMEIRLLRRELLKLKPDFDYNAIADEADRKCGERNYKKMNY